MLLSAVNGNLSVSVRKHSGSAWEREREERHRECSPSLKRSNVRIGRGNGNIIVSLCVARGLLASSADNYTVCRRVAEGALRA